MNTNNVNGNNAQTENIQIEETVVNNTPIEEQDQPINAAEEQSEEIVAAPAEEKKSGWREAVMSGTAGAVMGAAGALWISGVPFGKEDEQENNSGEEDTNVGGEHHYNNPTPKTDLPVAHNVNDDMSFSEAFAAARQEVGAGGVFVWHGGVYGTYYANEWNAMTPQQQSDFTHDAMGVPHTPVKHEPHKEENNDNNNDDNNNNDDDNNNDDNNDIPDVIIESEGEDIPDVIVDNGGNDFGEDGIPEPMIVIDGDNYEVEVLQAEENVDLGLGQLVNVGIGIVDGRLAGFIDATDNGEFDGVIIDTNENGTLDSEDYAAPIQGGTGLDMNTFTDNLQNPGLDNPNDNMTLASNEDYVNDGDVSQLV